MSKGKVLSVDYGSKVVGIASGDLEIGLAFPREVIKNKGLNDLVEYLLSLISELEVVMVVVGMPSTENFIVKDIESFVRLLSSRGVLVELVDEDFSTLIAHQKMEKIGDIGRMDANAAQEILQRFFDQNK